VRSADQEFICKRQSMRSDAALSVLRPPDAGARLGELTGGWQPDIPERLYREAGSTPL
jgi:hypothetical protein